MLIFLLRFLASSQAVFASLELHNVNFPVSMAHPTVMHPRPRSPPPDAARPCSCRFHQPSSPALYAFNMRNVLSKPTKCALMLLHTIKPGSLSFYITGAKI